MSGSVLDNTLIQCSHGKVHMAEVGSMKRLSACAWVKLFSKVLSCFSWSYLSPNCYNLTMNECLVVTMNECWVPGSVSFLCQSNSCTFSRKRGDSSLLIWEHCWWIYILGFYHWMIDSGSRTIISFNGLINHILWLGAQYKGSYSLYPVAMLIYFHLLM